MGGGGGGGGRGGGGDLQYRLTQELMYQQNTCMTLYNIYTTLFVVLCKLLKESEYIIMLPLIGYIILLCFSFIKVVFFSSCVPALIPIYFYDFYT